MRHLIIALAALALISCSRDPNYLKQKYLESGNKYYEQKRLKEAALMYKKALTVDRKFGPAYYRLALVDLDLQRWADAFPALQRAVPLLKPGTPDSDNATLKLAEIMLTAAQSSKNPDAIVEQVEPMVNGLLKLNPSSWQGHKLEGDLMLLATTAGIKANNRAEARKNMAAAIQEYRTSLASKPGDYVVSLALGRTLLLDGQSAEAESLFRSLIDKDKANLSAYYELFRIYVAQKKMTEAEAILKSAIAAAPKDAALRLTLARFYFGLKRQDDLIALLNEMKKDLKSFPDAYFQAGDFYLRVNQFDAAIKQYEDGIRNDRAQQNAYLKREIEVYIREGNSTLAQAKNEQILRNDPKDPESKGLRATFLLDKGQIDEALNELQSVVTARPNNYIARFNLGRAHFAKGEYEQARQEFDKCIELNPGYLPARFAQTQVAILRGDFDAALYQTDEILKIQPFSAQGRVMKAAALQRLGKYDEARKLLNEILEKNPRQVETLLELGVLDLNQKKTKDAMEHFRRASEAAPENIRGLLGESRALLIDGQPQKSVELVRQAATAHPSFELQRELGNAQMAARQFDDAIATYQGLAGSVTDLKQKGGLWAKIAEAYKNKNDIPRSIEFLAMAARALPENAAVATNLALLYDMVHDLPKARANYEKGIKLDPNNPLALNNLAYLLAETNGDLTQAMSYATEAKKRLPNMLEVNDTIGLIYLKRNIPDSAADEFKRLVVEAPLDPIYHYHYAMALQQKGDSVQARAQCEIALSVRPQKPLENQIREFEARLR
jgi:tetratricopeptide (TPR) repeat protein